MKRLVKVIIPLLCLVMLLSSCGGTSGGTSGSAQSESGTKNELKVAIRAEPSTLDPHNSTALANFAVQRVVYDTLVVQNENGEIVPGLAESWEVIDDLTVRFHLREGVKFSNGQELTSEDVVYSLQRATTEPGSASMFSSFDGENTKAVDPYTVDICVKQPFAAIYNYLASSRGDIICKSAMEEMGGEAYGRQPVGTGPFVLSEWNTGDSLVLTRNENYWGDAPAYDKLTFRIITEAANRTIELETGGVDIIYDVSSSDVPRLEENPNVKIVSGPGYKFSYITMNMEMAPYDDIRVREALVLSLDMASIVKTVYGDSAELADSLMAPTVFGYSKIGPYPYDPEKAKELLAEAGYADGLEITVMLNEVRDFINVVEIAQNMWKEVGITTNIEIMDQATLLSKAAEGTVSMGVTNSTPTTGDPDHALMIWPTTYDSFLRNNNTKIDEYLAAGKAAYDETERAAIYKEAMEYMWQQYNLIPICFTNAIYGTGADVENFECHPGNTPNLAKVTFAS